MDVLHPIAQALMRAVVNAVGPERIAANTERAAAVMTAELKAFLTDARYADERALVKKGQSDLAFASLTAECVRQIAGLD